jgi:hypothetical protein
MTTLVTLLLLLQAPPPAAPANPITYEHETRTDPPLHLHVVTIDLTNPAVSLVVRPADDDPDGGGPWQTKLARTSAVAARDDLEVAVNGDFFATKDAREFAGRKLPYVSGNWARVMGHAASDGVHWSKPEKGFRPALVVSPGNKITIAARAAELPKDAQQIVGGSQVIVANGKPFGPDADAAPRTAAGVDKAGKRLVLLVVDGRRTDYSAGLSIRKVAEEMVRLGCWSAINLDGGGSSTLVTRNPKTGRHEVRNRPSDGHDLPVSLSVERPVANALGVRVAKQAGAPPGDPAQPGGER